MQKMVLPIRELLDHSGPFTMFVPNNTAFAEGRIPREQRSKLLSQGSSSTKDMVNNQFMYHIGNITSLVLIRETIKQINIHSYTLFVNSSLSVYEQYMLSVSSSRMHCILCYGKGE